MNFSVNDSIIKAVSWTLVHSLWLGLAVALLAGLTVLLTKKSTSAIRYNLLAGLSIVFLLTIGFIFYNELETQKQALSAGTLVKSEPQTEHLASFSAEVSKAEADTPMETMSAFISDYGSWIVFVWFAVFIFKCIRVTGDLRQVYRARNYQTVSPPEMWQKRVSELQTLLRIKRSIKLLESRLVTIPSVSGFFKPVILVPVGLLSNIPQDQVEAILLHELAHIRRSDYAINLMQTFMEILFFFNPGILWLSSLLKDERENCCDDLAISVTNNKKEFVNALISFQEYSMSTQRFALQFGDQKMKLADRAKRILFNSNKMFSTREKYFLSACVAMTVTLFLVVMNVNSSSAQEISKLPEFGKSYNPDDIPEGTSIKYVDVVKGKESHVYIFKSLGTLYQVPENLENFKVDNKLITGKDREKYLPAIKDLISAYEHAIASAETGESSDYPEMDIDLSAEERIIDEASRKIDAHSAIIDKHSKMIDKYSEIIDKQAKILEEEASRTDGRINWKRHEKAQRNIEEVHRKIQAESDMINQESRKIDEQSRRIDEQSRKIESKLKLQEKSSQRFETEMQKMSEEAKRLATEQRSAASSAESMYRDITKNVIGDLEKAGYKKKIHSFELNEKNLTVNGKVQPAALYEKVKKYIKPGMRITYKNDKH